MFNATFIQLAFNVFLQSTLLIVVGTIATKICGQRRPAMQSAILQVTLMAVLACPVASIAFSQMGVPGLAILPTLEPIDASQPELIPTTEQPAPTPASIANHEGQMPSAMPLGPTSDEILTSESATPPVQTVEESNGDTATTPVVISPGVMPTVQPETQPVQEATFVLCQSLEQS